MIEKNRFHVSKAQLGILLEWTQNPHSSQGLLNFLLKLTPEFDVVKLTEAIVETVNAHDALFLRFCADGGQFYQYVDRDVKFTVDQCQVPECDVMRFARKKVQPLNLFQEMLFKASIIRTEKFVYVLYMTSHAVFDGATNYLFANEVLLRYHGMDVNSEDIPLREIVECEEREEESEEYVRAREYCLKTFRHSSPVKIGQGNINVRSRLVRKYSFMDRQSIDRFCSESGITPNRLFMSAYALTLNAYTGENSIVFDALYHGRDSDRKRRSYGMFVRNVPVKADFADDATTLRDLIRGFDENFSGNRHGVYPYVHFCRDLGIRVGCSYSYVRGRSYIRHGDNSYAMIPFLSGEYQDELSVLIYDDREGFDVCLEYNERNSDAVFAQRFLQTVTTVVGSIIKVGADAPLSGISFVSEAESLNLLELGLGEKLSYEPLLLTQMIDRQAADNPDRSAVVDEEGCITYSMLKEKSDSLALWLKSRGIGRGDTVMLKMPRRKEFVIAAIGIMKVGASYVPVDTGYPEERIAYMQRNSRAGLILTQRLVVNAIDEVRGDGVSTPLPEDVAYVIYTSGSTGTPKGVCISHRALTSFVRTCVREYSLTEKDRIMCQGTFCFDASVEDLYPILTVGGELHILSEESIRDLNAISIYITQNGITGCNFTTQLGVMLLNMYPDIPLRYLTVGGESLTSLPKNIKCRLFNSYGPTEFTVDATFWEAEPCAKVQEIPIGRPVCNAQVYVLDARHRLLPRGCKGELYLAGEQMADGYFNLPQETALRFVRNPYSQKYPTMYATGDIVRWGEDDNLYFSGRSDGQVKLRGFRIELDEVNAILAQHEHMLGVHSAIVKSNGNDILCSWYMSTEPLPEVKLKEYLVERLPSFMVPQVLVQIDEFPTMPNGKVDVKALPMPVVSISQSEIVHPESPREQVLYHIACSILGFSDFGVTDKMREIGMTSMLAMQFCAEAEKEFIPVKISDVMADKTIRELARGASTMVSWYKPYDDGKYILVMLSGVVPTHFNQPRMECLSKDLNILFVEPLDEHFKTVFSESGTYDDVVSLYYAMVDAYLPPGARIAAFMGISVAGNFAFTLVRRYYEHTGIMAKVIIGDAMPEYPLERDMTDSEYQEKYRNMPELLKDMCAFRRPEFPDEESFMDYVRREAEVATLRCVVADKVCNGHVSVYLGCEALLINTTADKPKEMYPELWRRKVKVLEVLNLNRTHAMMCSDVDKKDLSVVCQTVLRFVLGK